MEVIATVNPSLLFPLLIDHREESVIVQDAQGEKMDVNLVCPYCKGLSNDLKIFFSEPKYKIAVEEIPLEKKIRALFYYYAGGMEKMDDVIGVCRVCGKVLTAKIRFVSGLG